MRQLLGLRHWRVDLSTFSVRAGWNSFEIFTKRVGGIVVVGFLLAAWFTLLAPGQSRLEYQSNENSRQLQSLSSVPTDLATIKEKLIHIEERVKENTEDIVQNRTAAFVVLCGMLSWVATHLFTFFGGRIRRPENERKGKSE